MTHLPMKTPNTFAHRLASLQSSAWLPPALLLLALSSVFMFGSDRGHFYRGYVHNQVSGKNLAIAENLALEHHFLMFTQETLDADGKSVYRPYNRFPIGSYALIKLAILPFGTDLSAKIYAARMLTLLFFAAAAVLVYLSLRRIAFSPWIALTATLLAFSSIYCLYYSDMISNETTIDLFAVMLAFHGIVIFEQDRRFRQLLLKACAALLLGWHVYALLLPFIVFGLMCELIKTRPSASLHSALSLIRSRYLTLGVVTLLFGISLLTFNFTNEYFALNRETSLTELPSVRSMIKRTGIDPYYRKTYHGRLSWPAFLERQFYRIGMMSLPYAFSPPNLEAPQPQANFSEDLPRSFIILGIAASSASLIALLFIRRHRIPLAALTLSGFCWALPMRHSVAVHGTNFEAVFYIGVPLTLFTLGLICLRRLSGDRLIVALSGVGLLIFVASALRMAHLNNPDNWAELHHVAIDDFESIRNMTNAQVIQFNSMPEFHQGIRSLVNYYLAGNTTVYHTAPAPLARTPDFVITPIRADELTSLTPQNRKAFLYEWNTYHRYIDETVEQTADLLIRSHFDVYLVGNGLMYVKDHCNEDDTREWFFLDMYPTDESDLPTDRARRGFVNLGFEFRDNAVRRGERCIAIALLPDYDIARIYTGQYIQRADGSTEHLWEGEIHFTEAAR